MEHRATGFDRGQFVNSDIQRYASNDRVSMS